MKTKFTTLLGAALCLFATATTTHAAGKGNGGGGNGGGDTGGGGSTPTGTIYYYRVRAYNSAGDSAYSADSATTTNVLSNATLNGTYFLNAINIDSSSIFLQQIEATFNGNGNGTWENLNTTDSGTLTYSVASDGTASFDIEENDVISSFDIGQVSADARYIIIVDADASDNVLLYGFGVKKSTGLLNATLNGSYILNETGIDYPDPWTMRSQLTFDGNGNGAWDDLAVSEGSLDSRAFTYSVSDDGTLSVDGQRIGQVSPDGSVFNLGGWDGLNEVMLFDIGIKQSTGFSNAALDGTYLYYDTGYTSYVWTGYYRATLNGNGTGTWQTIVNSAGQTGSAPVSYSVSNDGALSVLGDIGGQVSPDGNLFHFSDTSLSGNDIGFAISIKVPE